MIRIALLTIHILILSPIYLTAAIAQNTASPFLFDPPTNANIAGRFAPNHATIKWQRPVSINRHALPTPESTINSVVSMNLFSDVNLEVILDTLSMHEVERYTWRGHVFGEEGSSTVSISVNEDSVVGNIRSDEGYFQIRYSEEGQARVHEMDASQFPDCATGDLEIITGPPLLSTRTALPENNDEVFDVVVLYTPAARTSVGGTSAMEALIDLAIDETNTIFDNSGINAQVRLVHQQQVAYTESGSMTTDLGHLATANDGHMDTVHTLRELYGADLVTLINNDEQYCGIGYLNTSLSPDDAFSVTYHGCTTGYYSFAHELAHNMGSHHAVGDSGNTQGGYGGGIYGYSNGWRWMNDTYRSVMAYEPGTRMPYFSNPNVSHMGSPTGQVLGTSNEASNAKSINDVSSTIANFRLATDPSTLWVDFSQPVSGMGYPTSPYNSVLDAVYNLPENGSGVIKIFGNSPAPESPENITISDPTRIESEGGTIRIGLDP